MILLISSARIASIVVSHADSQDSDYIVSPFQSLPDLLKLASHRPVIHDRSDASYHPAYQRGVSFEFEFHLLAGHLFESAAQLCLLRSPDLGGSRYFGDYQAVAFIHLATELFVHCGEMMQAIMTEHRAQQICRHLPGPGARDERFKHAQLVGL